VTTLTETIGAFIADTAFDAIPDAVIERAKVSLVHNLAVALAGRAREHVAHDAALRFWPVPAEATLLKSGRRVSVEAAAFANAALMHARSQDDTHADSTSHPGSPVMAAALALGEAGGASGPAFLRAIVLGYEALARIGRDFDHLITARGYRAAAVFGVFGGAAAASCLLRLSGTEAAHALGLAANLSGGTAQVWAEGSAEGPLQLGFGARNGICAARLAQAGATAAREALEGRSGVYRTLAGATTPAREILADLGTAWQIAEATVKPHPVCAILQGPVDILLDLCRTERFDRSAVADIALELSPYEAGYPGVDNPGPFASAIATKLSAQFSLALAIDEGRVTPAGLSRVADPDVLALSRRVRVVSDPALEPRKCRLAVTLANGRRLDATVDAPVGRPGFSEVARFARGLAPEMERSPDDVDRLVEAIAALDRAPDLDGLLSALRAG
jgi:2-methylcitrate dehydratase PrpD